jgi:aminoglycoside phosphotransferase (APT) family kinase protein
VIAPETVREEPSDPIRVAPVGWRRLEERAPDLYAIVASLHVDPMPLVRAVSSTPQTLVHGDWKMGNLGSHPDGRTVLLDWAVCGAAPCWADLTHYLSLNRARLPESKERATDAYRDALERLGVDTEPWWDRQRALSLLGGMVQFGWEKALGEGEESDAELSWWAAEASNATRWLQ